MQIVTVCQMNQARSPFAQAVLQRNFPEDQVSSLGISAIEGSKVLPQVIEIGNSWGIPIVQKESQNLISASNKIIDADFIIAAESHHSEVIRNFGYKGVLINYEEILEDRDFIPVDPNGLLPDAMARELGKVGALTLRAALDFKGFPHEHAITAVIPHGVSDLNLALAHAQMESASNGAILIDADLRAPLENELDDLGLQKNYFEIDQIDNFNISNFPPNEILTHKQQVDFPEKYFLSPEWRNWIQSLANFAPVVILTAPRHSRARRLADSYLASYMADEFSVISA